MDDEQTVTVVDVVHQGGGAKGLWSAHLWAGLEQRGYRMRRGIGTSVGAIHVAAVRHIGADGYVKLFEGLRTSGVMKKPAKWLDWTAYAGLAKHNGLYDWSPLRALLAKHLPAEPLEDTWVTRVHTQTQQLDVPLATAETVFHSALMPIIGRFEEWYDGGPREQVPLGKGLDVGIGADGVKVCVILTEPFHERTIPGKIPRNGADALMNVLGSTLRENKKDDLFVFLLLNWLSQQLGPLPRPGGGTYDYYPVEIWAPTVDLGDAMNFDNEEWKKVRRGMAELALQRGPITDPMMAK